MFTRTIKAPGTDLLATADCSRKVRRNPGGFKVEQSRHRDWGRPPRTGKRQPLDGGAKKIQSELPRFNSPYKKMGSRQRVACDTNEVKSVRSRDRMFVGDQSFSTICGETGKKVKGHYQGACVRPRRTRLGDAGARMTPQVRCSSSGPTAAGLARQ